MRIFRVLMLVALCAGCAAPPQKPAQARSATAYCTNPLRSETITGPLPPAAIPTGVSRIAKDRYREDLQQQPPTGAWYQGSDGSFLFCSQRVSKTCDAQRQFYRLQGELWEEAESDHMVC